jgi:hypothetical protein
MATKNNPGQFDCYHNAEPDEPMFVLLGRDEQAPELVRLWARVRALNGENPAKVAEALKCADDMESWRTARIKAADDQAAAIATSQTEPEPVRPLDVDELRAILTSRLCICGRSKKERNSFCQADYWRLNQSERQALYRPIGGGYEDAFAAAMERLGIGPIEVEGWREAFALKYGR